MRLEILLKQIDENQVKINNYRPFDFEHLQLIKDFYRVETVYSSNAIEGYTYTLSETKVLLEDGLTAGGKPLKDMYAVLGLAKAYDYMFTLVSSPEITGGNPPEITEQEILFFHKMLNESLHNEAIGGKYRTHDVFISGSKHSLTPHEKITEEMALLMNFVQTERGQLHPVIFAAELHKNFVYIHPFGDGNGRVARLIMNTSLIQKGFLPIIIPPVLRSEYIDALEHGRVDTSPFYELICQCELETQKDLMRFLRLG